MNKVVKIVLSTVVVCAAVAHAQGPFDKSVGDVRVQNDTGRSIWMTFYMAPGRNIKRAYGCVDAHSVRTFNNILGNYYYLAGIAAAPKGCAETPNSQHIEKSATSHGLRFWETTPGGNVQSAVQ